MREAARAALHEGEVAVSLHRPIDLKLKTLSTTETIKQLKIEMPDDTQNQEFIAVTDVISALTQGKNSLLKTTPHPAGECTVAVSSKSVDSLKLLLVRTPSKNKDLVSPSVIDQTKDEAAIGKKAANIAQELIKKHSKKQLTGEQYIKSLSSSPVLSITKEVIRSGLRGAPPIGGIAGNYTSNNSTRLPNELQCKEPQKIKVKLEGIHESGTLFTCIVTDAKKHADFWSGFSTRRILIEANTQDCQQGLLLSKITNEAIEVEVSLSIGVCLGKGNTDVVYASLIKIFDLQALTGHAIRVLSEQMKLDLDLPSN